MSGAWPMSGACGPAAGLRLAQQRGLAQELTKEYGFAQERGLAERVANDGFAKGEDRNKECRPRSRINL